MPFEWMTSDIVAAPYVLEALMALVKRAHEDQLSRNAYRLANQIFVFMGGHGVKAWETRPLLEVTRKIFDTIIYDLHDTYVSKSKREQLPANICRGISWVSTIYDHNPNKYVKEAEQLMFTHLTNSRLG
jgi:hypothetical protein